MVKHARARALPWFNFFGSGFTVKPGNRLIPVGNRFQFFPADYVVQFSNPFGARSSTICITCSGPIWRFLQHDLRGGGKPDRFIGFERIHHMIGRIQRISQAFRIEDGL